MKRNLISVFFTLSCLMAIMSSCSVSSHTMKTPNYHIEFYKNDFNYSKQVTAHATVTKIFCIDWQRLFNWSKASLESDMPSTTINMNDNNDPRVNVGYDIFPFAGTLSIPIIPIIGDIGKGKASSYALYNLMKENPGYDVVIYPQYHSEGHFFPFIYSKETVLVTARLGKIVE